MCYIITNDDGDRFRRTNDIIITKDSCLYILTQLTNSQARALLEHAWTRFSPPRPRPAYGRFSSFQSSTLRSEGPESQNDGRKESEIEPNRPNRTEPNPFRPEPDAEPD